MQNQEIVKNYRSRNRQINNETYMSKIADKIISDDYERINLHGV